MNKLLLTNPANPTATNFDWQTLKEPPKSNNNYILQPKVHLEDFFVSEQLFQQPPDELRPNRLKPLLKPTKNGGKKKAAPVLGKRKSRLNVPNRVGFPIRLHSVKVFKPIKLPRVAQLLAKPANNPATKRSVSKLPALPSSRPPRQPHYTQNKPDTSTNPNVYFWYYKESAHQEANQLPRINNDHAKILRVESEHMFAPEPSLASETSQKSCVPSSKKSDPIKRKSIVQMILQPDEDEASEAGLARRGSNITKKSVGFAVKEEEEEEEEDLEVADKNSERSSKNSTPDGDYMPGFPVLDVRMAVRESKPLTTKEMRELPLSEKFYKEAGRMIYEPKTAAFIPKGVNAYLARVRKNKDDTGKKLEDLWYPGLALN